MEKQCWSQKVERKPAIGGYGDSGLAKVGQRKVFFDTIKMRDSVVCLTLKIGHEQN
jgi:hypothetical protein